MGSVAVIAHTGKHLGGGLGAFRRLLAEAGIAEPDWYEVRKSRRAPARVRAALEGGAELVFVWGGDGMVQRCVDALAGHPVPLAIVPAGTANLLAASLGIPRDLPRAVEIGLHGRRRRLDVGVVNGERFAVMAGAGFDARLIRDVSGRGKRRWGRAAYFAAGLRHLRAETVPARVELDGRLLFTGAASCVLVGNIGVISGGITVFPRAQPDDGWLDVAVVTARRPWSWVIVLARAAVGRGEGSPYVRMGRARSVDVALEGDLPYELDGGDRPPSRRLSFGIEPAALTVCVPWDQPSPRRKGRSRGRRVLRRAPGGRGGEQAGGGRTAAAGSGLSAAS